MPKRKKTLREKLIELIFTGRKPRRRKRPAPENKAIGAAPENK